MNRTLMILVLTGLAYAPGCSDGPLHEIRHVNPWAREQWEADEKIAPTFHKRVAELASVRKNAPALSAPERQRLASDIADVLKQEKSPAMRMELVRTLGDLSTELSQTELIAATTDSDADVRTMACRGLGKRLKREAEPTSIAALQQAVASDASHDVRLAACRELGNCKDPAAAQALAPVLEETDPAMQFAAIQSLRNSTGKDFGNNASKWQEYLAGGNPTPPEGPSIAERLKGTMFR